MERLGLVGQVEKELEREIGARLLPRDGKLPSEQLLARQFGVSRTTVREALRRLAVRGLVVQRPGRRTRAVPLDEALTLENLGVALHERPAPHSECRRLLEGYFALKREATVELLATCAEHASEADLDRLGLACFALMDAARWEEPGWVEMEFGLLRLAARMADRPGHLLLIQSLERAFQGMRARLRPHLDAHAVSRWADLASKALLEPAKLRRELPALLRACDERVLKRLAPTPEPEEAPRAINTTAAETPQAESESTREEPPDPICPNLSACRTGSCELMPEESLPPEPALTNSCRQPEHGLLEMLGPTPGAEEKPAATTPREVAPFHAPPTPLPGGAAHEQEDSHHLYYASCRGEDVAAAPMAAGTVEPQPPVNEGEPSLAAKA